MAAEVITYDELLDQFYQILQQRIGRTRPERQPDAVLILPWQATGKAIDDPDQWLRWLIALGEPTEWYWFDSERADDQHVLSVWYGPDREACTRALFPFVEIARGH